MALEAVHVLLIEDSLGDVRLTQEALKDNRVHVQLSVVHDGVEAMSFLRRQGSYTAARRPDLVLLDLNLPRKNGREVLEEIKGDKALQQIPVVVLTTSKSDQDVLKAYDLHANCYVVKPVDFAQFSAVIKSIEEFWFAVVKLPQDSGHERSS